ncbi:hypothetical protein ACHAWC_008251 [Mediolabrus comicus]
MSLELFMVVEPYQIVDTLTQMSFI